VGIVFVISIFCFLLVHMLPGDPSVSFLGYGWTKKAGRAFDQRNGLTGPLVHQYWFWLQRVLHGNLGQSLNGEPVSTIIGSALKVDAAIIVYSQVLAFLVAIPLAVHASKKPGGMLDTSSSTVTFAFYCLPGFILITWFLQMLTVNYHIFPPAASEPFPPGAGFFSTIWAILTVLFLPSLIVAIGTVAIYFRLLRSELGNTLQEEFITVARSKGLSTNRVLWRHALRPSTVPVLATTGNNVALLITGLFIVEVKFNLNGVGSDLIGAVQGKDFRVVQGIALVTAIIIVIVNFAIDIITTFVDPRIARA
jgi:peptide/nickel transport system permease protein